MVFLRGTCLLRTATHSMLAHLVDVLLSKCRIEPQEFSEMLEHELLSNEDRSYFSLSGHSRTLIRELEIKKSESGPVPSIYQAPFSVERWTGLLNANVPSRFRNCAEHERWLRSHFDLLEMFLSEEHPDHVLHMEEIRDHLVEDLLPPNPKMSDPSFLSHVAPFEEFFQTAKLAPADPLMSAGLFFRLYSAFLQLVFTESSDHKPEFFDDKDQYLSSVTHGFMTSVFDSFGAVLGVLEPVHHLWMVDASIAFFQLTQVRESLEFASWTLFLHCLQEERFSASKDFYALDCPQWRSTFECVQQRCFVVIRDHRTYFSDEPSLLNVMCVALGRLLQLNPHSRESKLEFLKRAFSDAMEEIVDEKRKGFQDREEDEVLQTLSDLGDELVSELQTEESYFLPELEEDSDPVLQQCICTFFVPIVAELAQNIHMAEILPDVQSLMDTLADMELRLGGQGEKLDWDGLFVNVVAEWFTIQQQNLSKELENAMHADDWLPLYDEDGESSSSSCRQVVSGVSAMLPNLFALRFPGFLQIVRAACLCLSGLVQKYAMEMRFDCGDGNLLKPPMVPEKRNICQSKYNPLNFTVDSSQAQILRQQSIQEVCIRINNLEYLNGALETFLEDLERRWEEYPFHVSDRDKFQPRESLAVASELLVSSERELMKYLGARVVFFDMRSVLINQLYLPHPFSCTLVHVMDHLQAIKRGICDIVHSNIVLEALFALFVSCLEVLEWIVLMGGRDFSDLSYAGIVLQDLLLLEQEFAGSGSGSGEGALLLPLDHVRPRVERFSRVVNEVMRTPSQQLFRGGPHCPPFDKMPRSDPLEPFNQQTVFKVLLHRPLDKKAKKYVKKVFPF